MWSGSDEWGAGSGEWAVSWGSTPILHQTPVQFENMPRFSRCLHSFSRTCHGFRNACQANSRKRHIFREQGFVIVSCMVQGWKTCETEWKGSCFEVFTIEDGTMVGFGVLDSVENKLRGDQTETLLDKAMQHLFTIRLTLVISNIVFHKTKTVFSRVQHGGIDGEWQPDGCMISLDGFHGGSTATTRTWFGGKIKHNGSGGMDRDRTKNNTRTRNRNRNRNKHAGCCCVRLDHVSLLSMFRSAGLIVFGFQIDVQGVPAFVWNNVIWNVPWHEPYPKLWFSKSCGMFLWKNPPWVFPQ